MNRGLVTDFVGDDPTKPNLLGTAARGVWGDVGDAAMDGSDLAVAPLSGILPRARACREVILGGLMPDWAFALALAAARARDEAVGAANPALERVLLARFKPIEDACPADDEPSDRIVDAALILGA